VVVLSDVAHTDRRRERRCECRSRDETGFFAVRGQNIAGGGDGSTGETQADAAAVHLAAGAHALDDFLAGVTALGIADVAVFQRGFVRDLPFAEVIAKPRDPLLEAKGAERGVADGATSRGLGFFLKRLPQRLQVDAFHQEFGSGKFSGRAANDRGGNRSSTSVLSSEFR